jgi:hypothetical protein
MDFEIIPVPVMEFYTYCGVGLRPRLAAPQQMQNDGIGKTSGIGPDLFRFLVQNPPQPVIE